MPKGLDKFYTKPEVAKSCVDFLEDLFPQIKEETFLEPSAGQGVFLQYLPNYLALDIAPDAPNIQKQDFLTFKSEKRDYIAIGNPPFGKRSQLAINFFNKCALMCDVIALIFPVSFMKWSTHRELNHNFKLLDYMYLDENSFIFNGEDFRVRTIFQVWVRNKTKYDKGIDLRIKEKPPISHPDFKIWQFNNTAQSADTINKDWEIAVYRQGYLDYNKIFTRDNYKFIQEKMTSPTKRRQFFFIKPLTNEARKIILGMDFNLLAARNISTPGFGKGDFVSYYMELKEKRNLDKLNKN